MIFMTMININVYASDNFFMNIQTNIIKMKNSFCICPGFKKGKSEFVIVQ